MSLPPRLPKKPKRETRWRSQAHCNFVRSHACCACGSTAAIEVAHVRIGSGAGLGQKPDDWHTVSLCHACHVKQHTIGEVSFWNDVVSFSDGATDPVSLIDAFCKASPKAAEIRQDRLAKGIVYV